MSTPTETLLCRLEAVQQRGAHKWLARCPAHNDNRPSLSVQECDDGTALVHCFANCGAADVVAAVGLSLGDLFIKRSFDADFERNRSRKPFFSARDVLLVLDRESLVIASVAADIAEGRPVTSQDVERICIARERIARVREVCRV